MAGRKIGADLVEQALKLIMGGAENTAKKSSYYGFGDRLLPRASYEKYFPPGSPEYERNLRNWAKNSKLVDDAGSPIRLYHQTPEYFDIFQLPNEPGERSSGPGIWMTDNPKDIPSAHNTSGPRNSGQTYREGTNIMPVYARMKNPLVIDASNEETVKSIRNQFSGGSSQFPHLLTNEWREKLLQAGHDGIVFKNRDNLPSEYIALDPADVKSAIGNRGTFYSNNPRLDKANGGEVDAREGYGPGGEIVEQALKLVMGEGDEGVARIKLRENDSRPDWDAVMEDIDAGTSPHPFSGKERIYNDRSTFEISPFGEELHLGDIRALQPNQGAGTELLDFLKGIADKHQVPITGTAKVYHSSPGYISETEKLADWYRKRGFDIGEGDPEDGYEIRYNPKVVKNSGGRAGYAGSGRVVGKGLEEALRIAREGIEGLSRSEGKTPQELLGGFANQKPRVPFEEWRYEFEPTADLLQSKEFSPESLKPGDVIIPLIGDRTSTGRKITSIAGQPLETPAITEGGPDYMRGPSQQADKSVWASGKGVISQLEGRIQNALRASEAKGYKDPSVYGSYVAMGPQSGDFSTHTAEAVMGMLPGSKIKRADVKEFDDKMRERFADWPGIKSPKAADYVINANAGEHRKAFLDVMDSAYWRDKGFPDVSLARYATTTPELVSAPTEAAGYNIARITPSQKPELITQIHRSYPSTMHGEYVGGLPAGMTRDELFTQFSRGFDADPPARNYVMAKRRSFGMDPNAFQVMDEPEIQALIDKVERIKQGYEQGGEVYEDDDINDALRIAKDNGGSTGSVFMTDAKGINYDINGNIIPPEVTGPNPARSEATPEQVGQRAAQDPATFDALMQRYAVPDQDIARYEATKAAVAKQPYETQQMTHVGAPPMRDVKVDMPLLGGEKKITQAPYNVAGPMSMAAQTAYDLKTVPLYFTPFTAPIGAGLDIGEGVATGDPLQASLAALGAPGKYAKAAIIGGSNYLMSPAEAQAGPARWFSKAMEVANAIPMNKMTGEQALAMLRKGTSPEELRWTGTEDFLANTPQVTKQNLIDYINKNRIQTEDVVLGGSKPVRRDDVVPSETAIASMKNRWDELTAINREITDQMMLPPSERRASGDQLAEEQIAISDEMDTLHAKMIDDTIAEMGGLGTPPKFQAHSTPGGQGYEETLITLPNLPGTKPVEYQVFGAFPGTFKTREEAERHIKGIQEIEKAMPAFSQDIKKYPLRIEEIYEKPEFWEGHWERPDVLAHVRSQILDVTPPGANRPFKGWNADEFQSKWGQEGRDLGFSKEIDPQIVHQLSEKRTELMFRHEAEREKFIKAYEAIQDEKIKDAYKNAPTQWDLPNALRQAQEARRKPHEAKFKEYKSNFLRQQNEFTPDQESILQDAFDSELETRIAYEDALKAEKEYKTTSGVSRAPYVTSTEGWTDLSIKKSLDKAIDSGADFFTWTPGEVHAKRYNLRSVVDEIQYDPKHRILFGRKGGRQVFEKDAVEPDKLGKYVGKEMASKLLSQPTIESKWYANPRHVLSDSELEIGGEGMINYYDKIVPKRVEEVIRKATGKKPKIEIITVQTSNGPRQQFGVRIDEDLRNARFSDFNKGGRVTGGNTYDNDSSVAHALALTSEY